MARTRKITLPDGTEGEAEVVGHRATGEHWNEYLLDDKSVLRLKPIVTDILRVVDQHDAVGNPIYLVQSTNVIAVDPADELRKEA